MNSFLHSWQTTLERDFPAHDLDKVSGGDVIDEEIGKDINNNYTVEEVVNCPSKQA